MPRCPRCSTDIQPPWDTCRTCGLGPADLRRATPRPGSDPVVRGQHEPPPYLPPVGRRSVAVGLAVLITTVVVAAVLVWFMVPSSAAIGHQGTPTPRPTATHP
jgi:hypothetical protein